MAEAYSSQCALSFDGQGDIHLWLLKMKFWFSTKGYADKKEAHTITSRLTEAAFLVAARMPKNHQDSPETIRKALKAEFDKSVVLDRETAVQKLRSRVRSPGEVLPNLPVILLELLLLHILHQRRQKKKMQKLLSCRFNRTGF